MASTVLVLSLLFALPPGVVTPMSLVLGPLEGARISVHFDFLIDFILRPMP
jgi:hypothetical protein